MKCKNPPPFARDPLSPSHPSFHFCNINSFLKHKPQIKTSLSNSPHTAVLALCETHIDPASTASIKIPGFTAFNFPYKHKSSGILIYVRNRFPCSIVNNLTFNENGSMAIFLDVNISSSCNIRLGCVYIRPAASTSTLLNALTAINTAITSHRPCLFMGDFNCRHKALGDTVSTSKANHLLHMCTQHNLIILNTRDTPNTPTYQNSTLDLALTNKPQLFRLSLNKIDLASDHSALTCTWIPPSTPTTPPPLKNTWNIPLANWTIFKAECQTSFATLLPTIRNLANNTSQENINKMSTLITLHLTKAANKSIPTMATTHVHPRHDALWKLNHNYCNLHNKHKRIKSRIKRREATGLPATDLTTALINVKLTNKIQSTNTGKYGDAPSPLLLIHSTASHNTKTHPSLPL